MVTPYNYYANPQRIQTLLHLLQSVSLTQLDTNPDELPRFLLDNPRASVVFNNVQIDFGDRPVPATVNTRDFLPVSPVDPRERKNQFDHISRSQRATTGRQMAGNP